MNSVDSMQDCPQCGALNRPSLSFCEECGEALGATSSARTSREAKQERRQATADLRRARKAIQRVRNFFWVLAIIDCVFALVLWGSARVAWADPMGDGALGDQLRIAAVLQSLLGLTLVAGALFIVRQPFLWSLILASLHSLQTLFALVSSETFPWVSIVVSVLLWSAVVPTIKVRRLTAEFPDLQSAKSLREARLGAHLTVALVMTALVLGGAVWAHAGRIVPFDQWSSVFEDAWSTGEVEEVALLATVERSESLKAELASTCEQQGWRRLPTPLDLETVSVEGSEGVLTFTTPRSVEIVTRWTYDGELGGWLLFDVIPGLGERPEEFREVWNRGRVEDVVAFYRNAQRAQDLLTEMLSERSWDSLPRLTNSTPEPANGKRTRVAHESEHGTFRVSWQFKDGVWSVASLQVPRS